AGAFDDRIGPVLDCQLRLEAGGDASGEKALLGLRRQCRERREAFRRRQFEPVEIERGPAPRAGDRPRCRRDRSMSCAVEVDLLRKSGEFPMSYEELEDAAATVYEGI
ncbi:MAG: hypothetical protein WB710_01805, partial [Stellaceae bacterium]